MHQRALAAVAPPLHIRDKLIELAMDRDKFLEADEAKEFGIIDEVFDKRPHNAAGDATVASDITPA